MAKPQEHRRGSDSSSPNGSQGVLELPDCRAWTLDLVILTVPSYWARGAQSLRFVSSGTFSNLCNGRTS